MRLFLWIFASLGLTACAAVSPVSSVAPGASFQAFAKACPGAQELLEYSGAIAWRCFDTPDIIYLMQQSTLVGTVDFATYARHEAALHCASMGEKAGCVDRLYAQFILANEGVKAEQRAAQSAQSGAALSAFGQALQSLGTAPPVTSTHCSTTGVLGGTVGNPMITGATTNCTTF